MTVASTRAHLAQRSTLILLTMSLGVLVAQIDTSVVNLAVKQIGAKLGAGVTALQWVVDAYNLVYASLLLTAGTLADLYGRRRIFALGIALFTLGSLVCGLAPNAVLLVAGRAVAGLGAALEVPTSLAILTVAYPDTRERTQALGLWASCNGLAFIIGPTVGGALVDGVGWQHLPADHPAVRGDAGADVHIGAGIEGSQGPQARSARPGAVDCRTRRAVARRHRRPALGLGLDRQHRRVRHFSHRGRAVPAPPSRRGGALVPVSMLRNRIFATCLGVAACMTFGMYAMLFLTPLYLQSGRGDTAILAGVELLPMSVTFVVVSQLSGKIANAFGPRLPMTTGMTMMGAGLFLLALLPFNDSVLLVGTALLVIGCGLGLNTGPVNAVAVANVAAARSGTASGLVNSARMIGATLGVAVLGAVFATVAGGAGDSSHIVAGLVPAYIGGGIVEMVDTAAAFVFIRRDSLHPDVKCAAVRP